MPNFNIRNIIVGDTGAVAKYLATQSIGVYTEKDWLNILKWIWIDNPNVKTNNTTLGWMITDDEKKICGVLGNIPVQCIVHGELKNSYWATNWFVNAEVRNNSLELFMRYVRQQGLLMSNTPNENVEKLLIKMFKYKRAASPWFMGSYVFPLKPAKGFLAVRKNAGSIFKKTGVFIIGTFLKIPQAFFFYYSIQIQYSGTY